MGTLEYKGYYGSIEFSKADNSLFGKVLNMSNTLITYEGSTGTELYDDFKYGIEHYLEICQNRGIEPEKPNTVSMEVYLPSELHAKVAKYVQKRNISIESFILDSIERELERVN